MFQTVLDRFDISVQRVYINIEGRLYGDSAVGDQSRASRRSSGRADARRTAAGRNAGFPAPGVDRY